MQQAATATHVTSTAGGRSSGALTLLLLVALLIPGVAAAGEPTTGSRTAAAPPVLRLDFGDTLAPTGEPLNLSDIRERARKRSWERRERAMRNAQIPLLAPEPRPSSRVDRAALPKLAPEPALPVQATKTASLGTKAPVTTGYQPSSRLRQRLPRQHDSFAPKLGTDRSPKNWRNVMSRFEDGSKA